MKSTIRVKQDWDNNEPFIQFKLETANPNDEVDLADSALIHFIQRAFVDGIDIVYQNNNEDNRMPQIRLKEKTIEGFYVMNNSLAFEEWLKKENIDHKPIGSGFSILGDINIFDLGKRWGIYYSENAPKK